MLVDSALGGTIVLYKFTFTITITTPCLKKVHTFKLCNFRQMFGSLLEGMPMTENSYLANESSQPTKKSSIARQR